VEGAITVKVHLIGHATLIVETIDKTILMDPVLGDPHQEELFDITPRREVLLDRFPEFDIIVLSHKHLDHFDIRSLAKLPKSVPVITPKDPLLKHYLERLGFQRITQLADFSVLRSGRTTLMTTRSENAVPEFGMIFSDPDGVFWNQVDTILSPQTVHLAMKNAGPVDLLLASWQPMLESDAQYNRHVAFPYKIYERLLYNLTLVQTKALAPGANGFRYRGESSWLNHVVFPVAREQFLHDAQAIKPELAGKTFSFDPGDTLEIRDGVTAWTCKGSPYLRRQDDGRALLDFSPVDLSNSMKSQSMPDFDEAHIQSALERLRETLAGAERFSEHRRWQVIYQLEIIFPNKVEQWHVDFADSTELSEGRHPRANFISKITAAALTGLATSMRGWDYCMLGGYFRTFHRIFLATPNGMLRPQEALSDPLAMAFPYEATFRAVLDLELQRWGNIDDQLSHTAQALAVTSV
jgi:hypothetical protein